MFSENIKKLRKPKAWKHPQPITRTELQQLRDEFWDTAPHYGGQKGNIFYENKISSLYISRAVLQIQHVWYQLFNYFIEEQTKYIETYMLRTHFDVL